MKQLYKISLAIVFGLFFSLTQVHAQKGNSKFGTTTKTAKGPQPEGQVPLGGQEIYLLGPGITANGTQQSYISCDFDDGGTTVGTDDNDSTCYAVADSSGNFNITGLYYNLGDGTGCTTGQSVYFEARKGTVGGNVNETVALVSVPSSTVTCDYLANNTNTFIYISEFTNLAAAFVLGPFANAKNPQGLDGTASSDGLSSASTAKTALALGFDTVQYYVGFTNGSYTGSDTNLKKQLYTLADVIDECLDSTGTTSGSCPNLLSDTTDNAFIGVNKPIDTWQALASLSQDPTHLVSNEYNNIAASAAYQPYDTSAPSSWTIFTSGAPVISSVSALANGVTSSNSGKKGATVTIQGSNLTAGNSSTCPTVVVGFQVVSFGAGSSCGGSTLVGTLPSSPAQSSLAVYVNGLVSNQMPFSVTSK